MPNQIANWNHQIPKQKISTQNQNIQPIRCKTRLQIETTNFQKKRLQSKSNAFNNLDAISDPKMLVYPLS